MSTSAPALATLSVTLVRHAQSEDNATGILAGHKDTPLSVLGQAQARALGRAFQWVELQAVYSSDLMRARDTAAELVAANHSVPPPTLVNTRALREQYFGVNEGRAWSDPDWLPPTASDPRDQRYEGGESLDDVAARMRSAARRYILPRVEGLRAAGTGHVEGEHVAVVAHGVAIAELLRFFMSLHDSSPGSRSPWPDPKLSYTRVRLENTGCTRLELAVPVGYDAEGSSGGLHGGGGGGTGRADGDAGSGDALVSPSAQGAAPPMYVRIVQQNATEHLRGLNAAAAAASSPTGGYGLLLGDEGALGLNAGSTAAAAAAGGAPLPRNIGAYDANLMMRELQRAGRSAPMLSASADTDVLVPASNGVSAAPSPSVAPSQLSFHAADVGSATPNSAGMASSSGLQTPSTAHSSASTLLAQQQSQPPQSARHQQSSTWAESGVGSDVWQGVCVRVLPLFNGEGLKSSIEELNQSVIQHIGRTLDRSPARALDTLSADLAALIATGTYTLNAKLQIVAHSDTRLLKRLVELWTFFFGSILPYVEGVFLPLQTDSVLVSLTKTPEEKSSAGGGNAQSTNASGAGSGNPVSSGLRTERIDVRRIALGVFRDRVVLPLYDRLTQLFGTLGELDAPPVGSTAAARPHAVSVASESGHVAYTGEAEDGRALAPRLLQMTTVLASVLSGDEAQRALDSLFIALRQGAAIGAAPERDGARGGTNSTSAGARENRRGWLPRSAAKHGTQAAANAAAAAASDDLEYAAADEPDEWSASGHDSTFGTFTLSAAPVPNGAPAPRSAFATGGFTAGLSARPAFSEDEYLTSLRSPTQSSPNRTPDAADATSAAEGARAAPHALRTSHTAPAISRSSTDSDEASYVDDEYAASLPNSHSAGAPLSLTPHFLPESPGSSNAADDDAATPVQRQRPDVPFGRPPRGPLRRSAEPPIEEREAEPNANANAAVGLGLDSWADVERQLEVEGTWNRAQHAQ